MLICPAGDPAVLGDRLCGERTRSGLGDVSAGQSSLEGLLGEKVFPW